ncbi:MAG: hypothetical protein A2516_08130 [Alphaproteobacteria bacterium RIFOXYD12_FULL_60_8]|nr:MAG: hypothetical protein A2516_08130 [Alphaproteobacteria bacterium RIFOXYD12_FULL_60_8]
MIAGSVDPGTEAAAAAPFTRDVELFEGHTKVYWELARGRGGAFDRKAVRDAAACDLRILVPELAARFSPEAAPDLDAEIQFDVAGDPEGGFFVRIAGGECAAQRGRCQRPTTTVSLDLDAFVSLIRGTLDVRAEVVRKRIRVAGDRSLFARLDRLFPRTA